MLRQPLLPLLCCDSPCCQAVQAVLLRPLLPPVWNGPTWAITELLTGIAVHESIAGCQRDGAMHDLLQSRYVYSPCLL